MFILLPDDDILRMPLVFRCGHKAYILCQREEIYRLDKWASSTCCPLCKKETEEPGKGKDDYDTTKR